jgi:DNA modification methylase
MNLSDTPWHYHFLVTKNIPTKSVSRTEELIPGTENYRFRNKVFLGDSRYMIDLPDTSIDLIVTSPPYFSIKDYSRDGYQNNSHSAKAFGQIGDIGQFDDFIGELLEVWRECERVLKPNGKLIINTPLVPMLKSEMNTHQNRHVFDLNSSIQHSILTGLSYIHLLDTYIWNRTNPTKKLMFGSYPYPTNFYAQNTIEFITVYVKDGKSRKVSRDIKEQSKVTQEDWVEYTKQIWNIPIPNKSDSAFGKHSALMPEEIVKRCVSLYSFHGDTVLDPFAGSGTTLKVAKELGRNFVGYELVESYSDLINEKIGEPVCQPATQSKKKLQKINVPIPKDLVNSIKNEDCLTFLKMLPDDCIDLSCIDPPYNMSKGPWDTWPSDKEFLAFTHSWLNEVFRVTRPGGSLYVFNTPRNSAYILQHAEFHGLLLENWITWDKRDGFSSTKKRFVPCQETITFFSKPGPNKVFNVDAVRIPYDSTDRIAAATKKGILKNGKRWFPSELGKLCTDVWHISSERHKQKVNGRLRKPLHPTQKPLDLIERIILASSNEGDTVLDCFMGTGTTAVAAKKLNRSFIGCESDIEYHAYAISRLDEVNPE